MENHQELLRGSISAWSASEPDAEVDLEEVNQPILMSTPAFTMSSSQRKRKASTPRLKRQDNTLQRAIEQSRCQYYEYEDKRQRLQAETQVQIARIQAESQERIMERQNQFFLILIDAVITVIDRRQPYSDNSARY